MLKKISIILSIIIITIIIILGGSFCYLINQKSVSVLEKVSVQLKWLHQAQFAGNYVAKEKGFYADQGLDVDIIPFSYTNPTLEAVAKGDVDFGITGASELIMAREKGMPLKAIAVIYKTIPNCLYSLKSSEINKPQDLIGKIVGLEPGVQGEILYKVMMKKLKIDRKQINEIEIGYDATELITGITDVSSGYLINEPHQAIEAGYEVNIIKYADYGINIYADVLFTTEETIKNKPELVKKFVYATLEGWQYAIEHEDEAVDFTLKYATDSTRNHEAYMLNNSIPLIHTGEEPLGWMNKDIWQDTQDMLFEQGVLEKKININEVFTIEFLNSVADFK